MATARKGITVVGSFVMFPGDKPMSWWFGGGIVLFLAAIGALCDLQVLAEASQVAGTVAFMVLVVFLVHGGLVFGVGRLLRIPPDVTAVASQANVGGGTSALALARSLGRGDLVLPAILVGALGTAVGNYLGVLTAWLCQLAL